LRAPFLKNRIPDLSSIQSELNRISLVQTTAIKRHSPTPSKALSNIIQRGGNPRAMIRMIMTTITVNAILAGEVELLALALPLSLAG